MVLIYTNLLLYTWAGLAPGCNESAGKKKSVKISRAGVYLKPCLVEVAHCAVKDKTNTYYANKFNKISMMNLSI